MKNISKKVLPKVKNSIKITKVFLNLLKINLRNSIILRNTETPRECKTGMESERNNSKS